MILQVIVLKDLGAAVFGQPQAVPNIGGATRSLADQVNKVGEEGNVYAAHPEDFELFHLGEYNDADASYTLFPVPQLVVRCKDLKR